MSQDWRSPQIRLKNLLKDAALRGLAVAGWFVPMSGAETQLQQADAVRYFGQRPGGDMDLRDREERRAVYSVPRPEYEHVEDLTYTASGCAWHNGALVERFSVRRPSLREIVTWQDRARTLEVPRGAVVQSDFPYSYGDWLHTYLGTLLRAQPLDRPLLVPAFLARKSYVARDLQLVGVKHVVVEQPMLVRDALVLRKRNALFYWDREDVEAYQRIFSPLRATPEPGSITYLGRFDLQGEVVPRKYPSADIARVVEQIGGRTVRQQTLSPVTAQCLAPYVETVIGDHGSGILNILSWRPKTVIEIVVDGWWCNNNLFVARAMGVENYAVISAEGVGEAVIAERLKACFRRFGLPWRS